jgi:thiamine-phosphate pyrophosphorylase
LYGIAGPQGGATAPERQRETLTLAAELIAGGAPVVQLRDKGASGRELLETARLLRRSTRDAGVLFVVNDRLDIALLSQADGVHVGQDDLPVEAVRSVATDLGRPDLLVGLSTHDLDQVRASVTQDIDYIGFGPVFGTSTKSNALSARGTGLLAEAVRLAGARPVVAIGGISMSTAEAIARSGVRMAAVIGDVVKALDRARRAQDLHAVLSTSG